MHYKKTSSHVELTHEGRLGFLFKDSVIYGGATAISKSLALITFPLIVRHLSVAEFGTLDYFITLAGFLCTFFVFGQDSAVARFFYEDQKKERRQQIISQSLLVQVGSLALFIPLLWFGSEWVTNFLIDVPNSILYFKIVLAQVPFLLLINFSQNILKWTFNRKYFLITSLGFSVVQTLLLLLVLLMDAGLQGVMFVTLITTCCFGLLGLFFVREWLVYPSDLRHVKEIMPFAWPYGVICMMAAFLPTMERSITNLLLGANELGLYAAATKIAMLIGVLIIAFQTAWGPFYLSLHKKSDAFFTYNWVLKLFSIGICVFTLVLTLLAQPIILILASDRYSGAVIAVFPLIMGLAIQGTSWITEIGIGISKKSHLSLYSYAISLIVSFGSIILLASNFGILGISIGVLLGHISKAYTSYLLAQRAYPLPWPYVSVLTIFLFTLFSGFLAIGIGHYLGEWPYLLTLVVAILVVVFAGWRILFDQADRDYLVKIIRRKVFMNDKLGGI